MAPRKNPGTNLQDKAAMTQSIATTFLDYCRENLPKIRAELLDDSTFAVDGGRWRLRNVTCAIQWPGLANGTDLMDTTWREVAELTEISQEAHKPPTFPAMAAIPVLQALSILVELQARSIAVSLEQGKPVGEERHHTLNAAKAIIALGGGSERFDGELKRLQLAVKAGERVAAPTKAKAPAL